MSKFKVACRYSNSTFVIQTRLWSVKLDIRHSARHSSFNPTLPVKLDIRHSNSTFVVQTPHSLFKLDIRHSNSTFAIQTPHSPFKLHIRHSNSKLATGGPVKQLEDTSFEFNFQPSLSTEFYRPELFFFFDRWFPKYTIKTVK